MAFFSNRVVMNADDQNLAERQRVVCERANTRPAYLQPTDRIAVGRDFDVTRHPINGLRHPAYGDMCGWNIWSGEVLSDDPDYFNLICYEHLVAERTDWLQYLALPAGWRFLTAPGHEDIWFDQALFDLERATEQIVGPEPPPASF